jgi:hypothetical protein
MKNDLGLSKGLLNSVSSLLNSSSKVKAEEAKVDNERLAAHVKSGTMRPLSLEDAKVASYAAKAPERRVNDTITQLYTQSVAEHNAKQKAEAEAIKNAYGKMGGVAPIAEAKVLSPKQKAIAKVAGNKNEIDAMDLAVLRNRKKAQAGSVSDEKILDGESLDELNKETLGSYVAKATDSAADNAISLGYKAGRRQGGSEHADKLAKRIAGIKKAAGKMVKEEAVEEGLKDVAKSVAKKAFKALTGGSDKDQLDRLKKNMYKEEVEDVDQIDELSINTLTRVKNAATSAASDASREGDEGKTTKRYDLAGKASNKIEIKNRAAGLKPSGQHAFAEGMSPQAATTMKHIPNPSPALKKAAKDIKPGIAGYRDRIDMLKAGGIKEELKDTPGNSTHQCAIHVKHATMGEGRTLTSQHAQPDAEGQISWYAVMFEHGIEKVDTKDLEVLVSEGHMDHMPKKKKK